jgi:hypothetical protein
MQLAETIETSGVMFGEDASGASIIIHNDYCAVGTFMNQAQSLANGSITWHRYGRFKHGVARFYEVDNSLDNIKRYVLRQHNQATSTSNSFGHSPAGDGRHI